MYIQTNKHLRNKIYFFKLKTNFEQVWFKFRSLMKESLSSHKCLWYIKGDIYDNIYKNTELITMWMSLYTFFNNIFNNSLYYISSWSTFFFLYKTFWLLIDLKRGCTLNLEKLQTLSVESFSKITETKTHHVYHKWLFGVPQNHSSSGCVDGMNSDYV